MMSVPGRGGGSPAAAASSRLLTAWRTKPRKACRWKRGGGSFAFSRQAIHWR